LLAPEAEKYEGRQVVCLGQGDARDVGEPCRVPLPVHAAPVKAEPLHPAQVRTRRQCGYSWIAKLGVVEEQFAEAGKMFAAKRCILLAQQTPQEERVEGPVDSDGCGVAEELPAGHAVDVEEAS